MPARATGGAVFMVFPSSDGFIGCTHLDFTSYDTTTAEARAPSQFVPVSAVWSVRSGGDNVAGNSGVCAKTGAEEVDGYVRLLLLTCLFP